MTRKIIEYISPFALTTTVHVRFLPLIDPRTQQPSEQTSLMQRSNGNNSHWEHRNQGGTHYYTNNNFYSGGYNSMGWGPGFGGGWGGGYGGGWGHSGGGVGHSSTAFGGTNNR